VNVPAGSEPGGSESKADDGTKREESVVESLWEFGATRIRDATGIEIPSDPASALVGLTASKRRDSSVSNRVPRTGSRRADEADPRRMPASWPARYRRSSPRRGIRTTIPASSLKERLASTTKGHPRMDVLRISRRLLLDTGNPLLCHFGIPRREATSNSVKSLHIPHCIESWLLLSPMHLVRKSSRGSQPRAQRRSAICHDDRK